MPAKNEEPDSTPQSLSQPDGLADPDPDPESRPPVTSPLQVVSSLRHPDTPNTASLRLLGRISQLLLAFWRSMPGHLFGPVQQPRGPVLTGLRRGSSYFQVPQKEVA
jgi:hypothetical protein